LSKQPENRFDVTVVGNVGIDTNIYFKNGDIDFTVESAFTENMDYIGQAGGYSSRGFARMGLRTAFIGYVGDDPSGNFIKRNLKKTELILKHCLRIRSALPAALILCIPMDAVKISMTAKVI